MKGKRVDPHLFQQLESMPGNSSFPAPSKYLIMVRGEVSGDPASPPVHRVLDTKRPLLKVQNMNTYGTLTAKKLARVYATTGGAEDAPRGPTGRYGNWRLEYVVGPLDYVDQALYEVVKSKWRNIIRGGRNVEGSGQRVAAQFDLTCWDMTVLTDATDAFIADMGVVGMYLHLCKTNGCDWWKRARPKQHADGSFDFGDQIQNANAREMVAGYFAAVAAADADAAVMGAGGGVGT
jgi:hypothetical protein